MSRLFAKLAIVVIVGNVLSSRPTAAQILPPAKPAAHVKIIQGPTLELAHDDLAIVRWTTTNPGGDDEHFAIAHYGTDPSNLSQTAQAPWGGNPHRVTITGLKPSTDYFFVVESSQAEGTGQAAKSQPAPFETVGAGEQAMNPAPFKPQK